jgi:hypothetical protein
MNKAYIIKTQISVNSGLLKLSGVVITNGTSVNASDDGTIEFNDVYSQSGSGKARAFDTGKLIANSYNVDDSNASAIIVSETDGDVTVTNLTVTNSTNTQFQVDSGGSISLNTAVTTSLYGLDKWNVRSGGTLIFSWNCLDDLVMDNRTGFTIGGMVMNGRNITMTLSSLVVPPYAANADADQAFSLKPFDLKTGVNILFTEVFSDLVLLNSAAGPEAFEFGMGTAVASAAGGGLTGTMEDILIALSQNFVTSPGTSSHRAVMKTEGQLVSGGGSVYINFGTTGSPAAGYNGHTFAVTGTIVLKGYLV